MVLEQTSGGWTATEVDPAVTSDVSLIESASQIRLDQPEARPGNVLIQALMVMAAAAAAGVLVFFVVRAAVSSDATQDEQAMDLNELPSVGLDPENGNGSVSSGKESSRSGSQRNTLDDGIPEEETPAATPTDIAGSSDASEAADSRDTEGSAAGAAGLDTEAAQDQTLNDLTGPADDQPGFGGQLGPTTSTTAATSAGPIQPSPPLPGLPSLPTTAAPAPTVAPTTAAPTTESSSAPPTTSQPTTAPQPTTATTAAPTTETTPTTAATSTTISSTTSTSIATGTTLAAPPLISAPIEGSVHTWETGVLFEAKVTTDAVRYCWELESADTTVQECNAGTGYALPGGAAGVDPGIVIVTAEAQDAGGAVLNSETMTIKVIARDLIESPSPNSDYDQGDDVRVDFEDIPTATEYCVTLVQDSISLPTVCENDDRVSVRLRRFDTGPVTVNAEVMRGQQVIGRQSIEISYTD